MTSFNQGGITLIKFYGYDRCGTCRKARKWLDEHDVSYQFIDVTQKPPSKTVFKQILASGKYPLKALFNTSGGEYRRLNMKEKLPRLSHDAAISALSGNGGLVKRPVVTDGKRFTVGFRTEDFADIWG